MAIVQRNVGLNEDDVKWFESTYPKASLSGHLSLLLEKYRRVTEHTPDYYAEIAARELKEELET